MHDLIHPGISMELEKVVEEKLTAKHVGSGRAEVLATPVLCTWMEEAAFLSVEPFLEKGYDTVGTEISISHMAATPVGMEVRVVSELTEINGKLLVFKVKAYDQVDKIGEGVHKRAIVEQKKFITKTNQKGK